MTTTEAATLVRFIHHAPKHSTSPYPRVENGGTSPGCGLIGTMIPISLPPITPDPNWTCGTTWIWQVAPSFLARLGIIPDDRCRVFVCEHQIELD